MGEKPLCFTARGRALLGSATCREGARSHWENQCGTWRSICSLGLCGIEGLYFSPSLMWDHFHLYSRAVLVRLEGCSHPVVMKGLCAECGQDLTQ